MKRKVIEIDEAKCNGCGECIPNCAEGALQLIDGKARLISDLFCDGLGACVGHCPTGAMQVVEREAEPYEEKRVMDNIIRQGDNTIRAHLKHLKDHGETALLQIAVAELERRNLPVPELDTPEKMPCGCPGSLARKLAGQPPVTAVAGAMPSQLRQWPIQLRLQKLQAAYFDNADLLIAADCVAYALGDFHSRLLAGKVLVVFCPKLDADLGEYVEKLAAIFRRHYIRSVTVARMEVPCCGGTVEIVEKALALAGKTTLKPMVKVVGIDGEVR